MAKRSHKNTILSVLMFSSVSMANSTEGTVNSLERESSEDLLNCAMAYSSQASQNMPYMNSIMPFGANKKIYAFAGEGPQGEKGFFISTGDTHLFYKGKDLTHIMNASFKTGLFKLKPRPGGKEYYISQIQKNGELKMGTSSLNLYDTSPESLAKKNPPVELSEYQEVDTKKFNQIVIDQVIGKSAAEIQKVQAGSPEVAFTTCRQSLKHANSVNNLRELSTQEMKPRKSSSQKSLGRSGSR